MSSRPAAPIVLLTARRLLVAGPLSAAGRLLAASRLLVAGPLLVVLLLAACAPMVHEVARPVVVVVAGPMERPVDGLAEAMRAALRREGFGGSFGPAVLATIAERRNLSEAQALGTAAELGRIGGAEVALYVGVARLDRHVVGDRHGGSRAVLVRLQLRATLVDSRTGALLWSTRDASREAARFERTVEPLRPLRADPSLLALRDAAVSALARDVMDRLRDVE
jgi:hypothetical protein